MNDILLMFATLIVIGGLVWLCIWLRRRPRRMKTRRFQEKWRDLQKLCANKDSWGEAILAADALLDEALKKKRFAGKSMGERLTHAQRLLTDNEAVWFGHKLRNKLLDDPATKLKENDVKEALIGIRQALKDLGALPANKIEQAAPVPEVKEVTQPKAKAALKPKPAPAKAKPVLREAKAKPAAPAKKPVRRKVVQ